MHSLCICKVYNGSLWVEKTLLYISLISMYAYITIVIRQTH